MLHVWGRPFFIVADDSAQVAEDVVRYLNTPLDAPADLLGPLRAEFPEVPWDTEATITGNYMVGGYVPPAEVGAARATVHNGRDVIVRGAEERSGWSDWALELRKIDEALALAQHLGYGFCEATEVYSGMEGNLN